MFLLNFESIHCRIFFFLTAERIEVRRLTSWRHTFGNTSPLVNCGIVRQPILLQVCLHVCLAVHNAGVACVPEVATAITFLLRTQLAT
jgi:hypothetical protein